MGCALPMIMVMTSFIAWLISWRDRYVRQRQNRHIVVKVAGRDCLLSPILARYQAVLNACAPVNLSSTEIIFMKLPLIKTVYCGASYGFGHLNHCEINRH